MTRRAAARVGKHKDRAQDVSGCGWARALMLWLCHSDVSMLAAAGPQLEPAHALFSQLAHGSTHPHVVAAAVAWVGLALRVQLARQFTGFAAIGCQLGAVFCHRLPRSRVDPAEVHKDQSLHTQ